MLGKVFEELVTGRHDSGARITRPGRWSPSCAARLSRVTWNVKDTGLDTPEAITNYSWMINGHDGHSSLAQARPESAEALETM